MPVTHVATYQIYAVQIVPDDTHQGVHALMEDIWLEGHCRSVPSFFSTDNVGKDQYNVADSFAAICRERASLGLSTAPDGGGRVVMSQDEWHAKERVARPLKRSHPDYFRAFASLKKVFGRCAHSYTSRTDPNLPA